MNQYYVMELKKFEMSLEAEKEGYSNVNVEYREMTDREIIQWLEKKVETSIQTLEKLKVYLGKDMYESIVELEEFLYNNTKMMESSTL